MRSRRQRHRTENIGSPGSGMRLGKASPLYEMRILEPVGMDEPGPWEPVSQRVMDQAIRQEDRKRVQAGETVLGRSGNAEYRRRATE